MALVLASALLSEAGFAHGFSTRAAGDFSVGHAAAPAGAFLLKQVHSTRVHVLTSTDTAGAVAAVEADALVTVAPGPSVGIRVADCVPVLIVDPETGRAAAAHAGWRGVAGGILGETLQAFGADASARVRVALGPSIGPCCFEVGAEVAAQLVASSSPACLRASAPEAPKAYVDLRRALEVQLATLGVDEARIERVGGCTLCDEGRYHSYRRDGVASGRMVGWVAPRRPVATRPQLDS